ncbi:GDSL-type esterase/lipase family protein [Streptomyces sp. NPDC090106]|uniref:GDSL-type esterase/lipase family protein n=1 Tax=Streptomyces sp. NPDC090106 TaxID=3365946 RepID=UPI0038230737
MLRFMPVGDSMTIGSAGEHTWRYRLWEHLRDTYGGPFTLVGPRETLHDKATDTPTSHAYADPDFPRAHLAGWGEGWLHMAPLIGDAVRAHRADVLLVSLGLIDLGFYTNAEQTAENVRRFVAEARGADPRVRMVLLPVIHNTKAEDDPLFAAQVARFNELLAKTAADLDEPRSPLLLASPPPSYDFRHDTYDGTHPNTAGEHRIAAAFADAMHQAWALGEPYTGGHLPRAHSTPLA